MKILLVDDNEINRQLLEMMLEDRDYQCLSASNGREAVDCFESHDDIDLILMDYDMPVMSGMEATKIIKEKKSKRYTPIIFVTALDDQETLEKCLSIGGDDFISKPINEAVLLAKLKAHERTSNYHREIQVSHEELAYHRLQVEREHNIVEKIFNRCMDKNDFRFKNVNHYISPMSQFNGDVLLTTPSPFGGIYVLLGDFTGHGLAASIGCLPVSDMFFAMTRKKSSVGDIAREINIKLQDLLPDNMFFCATIVELDQAGNRLTVWSGGMNDILIMDSGNSLVAKVQAQHMPLGILETDEFESLTEIVTPFSGHHAYLYTDGIVEAKNSEGELFGEDRLEQELCSFSAPRVEKLKASLKNFVGDTEQSDDVAVVEIKGVPVGDGEDQADDTELNLLQQQAPKVMPWNIALLLKKGELQNSTVIEQLITLVKSVQGAGDHGDLLFTLFSELFSNSLEHGLLRLDSTMKEDPEGFQQYYQERERRLEALDDAGEIKIELYVSPLVENEMAREDTKIHFKITDSGPGFDVTKLDKKIDEDLAFSRGMTLVESLCEEFSYTNGGKTVNIVYSLGGS